MRWSFTRGKEKKDAYSDPENKDTYHGAENKDTEELELASPLFLVAGRVNLVGEVVVAAAVDVEEL